MDIWKVTSDTAAGTYTHTLKSDSGHALLVWSASSLFQALGISASIFYGDFWWTVHDEPNVTSFETEYGVETERWEYNSRSFSKARQGKQRLLAQHQGFSDFFVPISKGGRVVGVLVVGPIRTRALSSREIQRGFSRMTGRQGHAEDPSFAAYLRATLATLALEPGSLEPFGEFLDCFASLVAGEGPADDLANRAHVLRAKLETLRLTERSWDRARDMLSERFSHRHYRAALAQQLGELGLFAAPDDVLVGLTRSREPNPAPIDEMLRRDAFQRRATELARSVGNVITGRVGEHGIVYLSAGKRGPSQRTNADKRRLLLALGRRAASVAASDFGLTVHEGASFGTHSLPLFQSYQTALGAAETALAQGKPLLVAEAGSARPDTLRKQREELYRALEQDASTLAPRFERYIEMAVTHAGDRVELGRTELELCFEHLTLDVLRRGSIDPKTLDALRANLDRTSGEARNLSELGAAYRIAASDLWNAIRSPVAARQDRSLRGALSYIAEHYSRDISLNDVARAAGFAPKYFSRLFRVHEGVTFAKYLARLRLERGKELLSGTDHSVTRVSELSGYRTTQYFCRVFMDEIGVTPLEYRQRLHPKRRLKSIKRKLPKYKNIRNRRR